MIYKVYYVEMNGSTEIVNFSTKKHAQAFLDRNDIAIESILKITRKGETDVTHLFDIKYFADSAETDTENSEEYLSEKEQEYLDKLDRDISENDLPELNYFEEQEYFIGREYYPNKGFFGKRELEKLLWKVLDLIKWYPEKNDYEKTLDEILKMDRELNCINRKPFSDKDKRIFNTQIVLARLRGLVTFEMWKHSYTTQRGC